MISYSFFSAFRTSHVSNTSERRHYTDLISCLNTSIVFYVFKDVLFLWNRSGGSNKSCAVNGKMFKWSQNRWPVIPWEFCQYWTRLKNNGIFVSRPKGLFSASPCIADGCPVGFKRNEIYLERRFTIIAAVRIALPMNRSSPKDSRPKERSQVK